MNGPKGVLGRPPEVWTLVVLDVTSAALCLVGAVRPATPSSPVLLDAAAAAVAAVFAAVLWWAGRRTPAWVRHLNVVVHAAGASAIIASAATGEGAMSAAFSYVVLALYVAAFHRRAVARAYVALFVAASGAAVAASDVVTIPLTAWLPAALATAVSALVVSSVLEEIRSLAVTDPLTGMLNRAGFDQAAARERAAAARTGDPLTLVAIDLNDFKLVNDLHGHAAGDAVLVELVDDWRRNLRARDLISRRGGDEFVLLLPGMAEEGAEALVARMRSRSPHAWSYGVSSVLPGDHLEDCLHAADERMYRQKATQVTERGRRLSGPVAADVAARAAR